MSGKHNSTDARTQVLNNRSTLVLFLKKLLGDMLLPNEKQNKKEDGMGHLTQKRREGDSRMTAVGRPKCD